MTYTTLVDVNTLAAHLDDPAWVIVDVRHQLVDTDYGQRVYAENHIPGAVFLHCDDDLSGVKTGGNGRHPLPDPEKLAQRFGDIGIGPKIQVVVYDDANGMIAGRLWWLLRWLGHDQVALLDGGLQAWQAANGVLTQQVPKVRPVSFVAKTCDHCVDTNYVQAFLATSRMHLVDARSPDRYRGENETIDPVAGHIPGAVNRFFRENLQADGRFKPAAELRTEWQAILEEAAPEHVVHQCGSGISACHNMLAMEIAGLHGSRLYAGSWSEWCSDSKRPVDRG
jgi:thiosulfate/3-mercaptopyruvate sulfurtransferase